MLNCQLLIEIPEHNLYLYVYDCRGGILVSKNNDKVILKDIISKGQFVPNQIVLDLIQAEVNKSPNGYVLDGFPRYMEQVRAMEDNNIGVDYAVFLDVSREEVMNRLLARGRVDDTREIINNRIDLYKRETGPVVEYFRDKPGFIQIRAEGEPDIIGKEIIQRIENEGK